MQSAIAQKKRLEEKNSKILRELAALPSNRNCFECGQRGPTYVNITEGSFCCTSCSGILRGLNPPHRVKSISMATFTNEEIEKLRTLGNAENTRTWLGLYEGPPPAMTNRELIQLYITKKYEQKAWYVSSAELAEQEKLMSKAKEIASQGASSTSSRGSRPPELDLLASDPFGSSSSSIPIPANTNTIPIDPYNTSRLPPQPFSPPSCMAPPPPLTPQYQQQRKPQQTVQQPSLDFGPPAHSLPPKTPFDVLGSISCAKTDLVNTNNFGSKDIFADFDNKFNDLSIKNSSTIDAFGTAVSQPSVITKSATVTGLNADLSQPFPSSNPFQVQNNPVIPPQVPIPDVKPAQPDPPKSTSAADKYSALAELDQLFHHPTSQGDGKPAWMPSGFSTGLPPATYAPAFPDPKPLPVTKPAFPESKPAFPESKPMVHTTNSNGIGSIPKSNTMGTLTDFGMNNPFFASPPHANSQVSLNSNPFATSADFGVVPQQQISQGGFNQPGQPWGNPFNGVQASAAVPTTQNSNTNWNPFL